MILYRKDIIGHLPGEFYKDSNRIYEKLSGQSCDTPQKAYNSFDDVLYLYLKSMCPIREDEDAPSGWIIEWKIIPELKNTGSKYIVQAELSCYECDKQNDPLNKHFIETLEKEK